MIEHCPRLTQVALPIREISAESVRGKSPRRGTFPRCIRPSQSELDNLIGIKGRIILEADKLESETPDEEESDNVE